MYYVNRRKAKRMELIKEIIAIIIFVIALGGITVGLATYHSSQDYYYHTAQGQMVDRPCIVTEIEGDLVTVETVNGGEKYAFYGDGFTIDEEIICTFNMANEIIDAK